MPGFHNTKSYRLNYISIHVTLEEKTYNFEAMSVGLRTCPLVGCKTRGGDPLVAWENLGANTSCILYI